MSSAISYSWSISDSPPEEILKNNKKYFEAEMNRLIDHVKELIKKHLRSFKNIKELVKILEAYRDEFLSSYTLEILNSPNHTKWVDEKMSDFNDLALRIKSFLKFLDIELESGISLNSLKSLISKVPKECAALRREIEEKIDELINKLLKKIEEARKSKDIQQLEELYQNMPEDLKEEKQKLSNEILRLKLEKQRTKQKKDEKLKEEDYDNKVEELKQKAKVFYEKLNKISPQDAIRLKPLVEELKNVKDKSRASAIVSEIKYTYTKAVQEHVMSEVLKEDVKYAYADIEIPKVKDMVREFLRKEKVSREEYDSLNRKIREILLKEQIEKANKKRMEEEVKLIYKKLREMGYYIVDEGIMERLLAGEIVEINTPFGEDYVLRLKFDEKEKNMTIKFVRYVEDEKSLSEYDKAKDISIAKRWCKDYDKLIELLKENGIFFENIRRIEPEQRFYYERKKARKEGIKKKDEKKEGIFRKQI